MQAHELKPATGSKKRKKRVGRGNASGHGTTATRGTKGQRARTGGRHGLKRLGFKFILQRVPKSRGFKSIHAKPHVISIDKISAAFGEGASVDIASIKKLGLVPKSAAAVKIVLGAGDGDAGTLKRLNVVGCSLSKSAKEAIKAAGGTYK